MGSTYKDSGVNIDAGDELVERIKPLVRKTFTSGVITDIGAFGAFFKPDFSEYDEPVLVSSVDGVGTKLKVAFAMGRHHTVGQDLVNHCVNDIAVCGATPLFFLDYFSTGRLDVDAATDVVRGFAVACRENECALIGGETAEMPGLYAEDEYDLAGTIVGVVDRSRIIDGNAISNGDLLIGLSSTGLHTNGYSLARKVLFSTHAVTDTPRELNGNTVGDTLLEIHRSYLSAIKAIRDLPGLTGLVHITGGGIPGNCSRVVPKGLRAAVDYSSWVRPAIFSLIGKLGDVPELDMRRTFNLGIGLVIVAREESAGRISSVLDNLGENPIIIGSVVAS